MWCSSAVVVDLPLVPVMPTKRAARARGPHRAVQVLDVAEDRHARAARAAAAADAAAGSTCGMPGDSSSASQRNRPSAGFATARPRGVGRRAAFRRSSQQVTSAPQSASAARGRQPGAAEADQGDAFAGEGCERAHRIFNVARPDQRQHHRDDPEADHDGRLRPALLLEMVVQRRHEEHAPPGALVPEDLDDDATRSRRTNSPPTIASTISCLVATATPPSAPPSASEPVSPMKTAAGGALNQRKPRPAPTSAAQEDRQLAGAGDGMQLQVVREARGCRRGRRSARRRRRR